MPSRSSRWKRNKQLVFLGLYLVVLTVALCLLADQYPTAWLLVVAAVGGCLQPVFILLSLRRTWKAEDARARR